MFDELRSWWIRRGLWGRVRKHGWTAVYVGDYTSAPTWAYSIGFDETLDQPEVIFFDVPQDAANGLMWTTFRALRDGTLVLEDGKDWTDAPEGRCVWRKVHPSQVDGPDGWFSLACKRRQERTGRRFGIEGFQLVLSDEKGLMPWDVGYDERLRPRQPALWLPGDESREAWEMNPLEREARRLVGERGWTAVPIDGPELHWAYTIGLPESMDAPELISFGINGDGCAGMLIEIQCHLRDGRLVLEDGLRWNELGYELCWRRVHPHQYLGLNWLHLAKEVREERTGQRNEVDVFQAFVSDEAGLYPWDEGCDPDFRDLQPQLYLAPEVEPHARRMLAAANVL